MSDRFRLLGVFVLASGEGRGGLSTVARRSGPFIVGPGASLARACAPPDPLAAAAPPAPRLPNQRPKSLTRRSDVPTRIRRLCDTRAEIDFRASYV